MERKELKKLADLARIKIREGELKGLQRDMEAILGYISQIQGVSASPQNDAEKNATRDSVSLKNVLREDEKPHDAGIYTAELLNVVPQRENDYVKVKKIL